MSDEDSSDQLGPKGIQSVEMAFRLIEPFMTAPGPFTMTRLAAAAGMAPSKASFYLTSLVRVGLLAKTRLSYSLGPSALQLGLSALAQIDVVEAAQETIHQLRDELGFPLFLSVWAERGPTIVQHLHGTRSTSWSMQVGAVLPPLSATGRALLAYSEPSFRLEVIEQALADATPDDPWFEQSVADVQELLGEIRESGISPRSGVVIPGFGSIAAAVIGHDGTAAAAITVISDRRSFEVLDHCKQPLLDAASTISQLIGGMSRT